MFGRGFYKGDKGKLLQTVKVFNVVRRGVSWRYDVMSNVDVWGVSIFTIHIGKHKGCVCVCV